MEATPVIFDLTNLHCYDEGDSLGSAEPYLWTVFFKIDGDTVHVDRTFTLQGTATVVATTGNHGDLGPGGVDAGDDVLIPPSLGHFETTLKPIPLDVPIAGMTDFPGTVGCIVVLLEQDSTPDSAVTAGRAALTTAVQSALDAMIPTLDAGHTAPTQAEIDAMTEQIGRAVEDAISDEVSVRDWLGALGNMDDKIGSAALRYSQTDVNAAIFGGIAIEQEWENEGDWKITGRVGAAIDALAVGCVHKPSGNMEAHRIEVCVQPRHLEVRRMASDHRVHVERDGSDVEGGEGVVRALAAGWRLDGLRGPADSRVLGEAPLLDQADVSRPAASDGAAVPRSGCSTARAAA
jgi:hypothetical protein